MYRRTIDRRFTQMIAYFLVMNSKRCIYRLLETRNNDIPGELQILKACRHCETTTISHFMNDVKTTTDFLSLAELRYAVSVKMSLHQHLID